jgi:hypothetical protein
MTTNKIALFGLSLPVLMAAASGQARADEAADTATARILGGDGVLLADAGDCPRAIEKLGRAEALHHAATTAARLGECEIAVGRLVAGSERLQRVLREPLPSAAPAASVAALGRARTILEQSLPRIPTVRLSVIAPPSAALAVTLDGESLSDAILGTDRPTDPGVHKLRIAAEGFLPLTREFSLSEGEAKRVSLELQPDPNAKAVAAAAPDAAHNPGARPASGGSALGPVSIVSFAIAALGLGAGVDAGIVVARQASDLSRACGSSDVCPSNKQSELSSTKTWATVSTVGFAVAGAGLATAVIALVGGHKESSAPSAVAQVGPAYVGLAGSF